MIPWVGCLVFWLIISVTLILDAGEPKPLSPSLFLVALCTALVWCGVGLLLFVETLLSLP